MSSNTEQNSKQKGKNKTTAASVSMTYSNLQLLLSRDFQELHGYMWTAWLNKTGQLNTQENAKFHT